MTVLLAIVAGGAMGYVLGRGNFCFHSTWRGLLDRPPRIRLARAYLVLLVVTTPLLQLLIAVDVVTPSTPWFTPWANVLGGMVFGIGMVIASSCISGLFYKLGQGMLGAAVGLGGWAIGDIVVARGPLSGLRDELTKDPVTVGGRPATLTNALPVAGAVVAAVCGVVIVVALTRTSLPRGDATEWGPARLGAATAAVILGAWLLVTWEGSDYPFGTSGVPTRVWDALVHGETAGSWWIPLALVALVPGARLAARRTGGFSVRGETRVRYGQLGAGGLVMGVGAGIAGGCNLGHSMIGVPLLALGSIATTVAMIGGVALAHLVATTRHPAPTPVAVDGG